MSHRSLGLSAFSALLGSLSVAATGCSSAGGLNSLDAATNASTAGAVSGGSQGTGGAAGGDTGGQTTGGAAGTVATTGGLSADGGTGTVIGGSGGQPSGGSAGMSSATGGQRTGGSVAGGSGGQPSGGSAGMSSATGGQRTGGSVAGASGALSSGGAAGSAACPVLTQTKSSRAAHSAGFPGTIDAYDNLSHVTCTTVADCASACVKAGGAQVSCAASECVAGIVGSTDRCMTPTFWFYLDRLRVEGGTTGSSAWIAMVNRPYRDQLIANDFQFEISPEATIQGIAMSINRSADSEGLVGDYEVRLVRDAATTVGLDRGITKPWPTEFQYADYGGPTDLWGTAWTPADVNSTGFGVALTPTYLDTAGNSGAYVDFIRATVTYSVPCN